MKKLILMLLVLVGGVMQASADYDVYFKPGNAWSAGSARFALYMYTDNNTNEWVNFDAVADYDGYFKATFKSTYTGGMIIVRFSGSSTENRWNNNDDNYVWGQSANLPVPSKDVFYDFSSLSEVGSASATGTMYELGTWYLAANHHITNGIPSNNDWSSNSTDNKLKATTTAHVFTLSVEGKPIKAGTYGYKFVSSNNQWVGQNNGSNFDLTISDDDYYDITYTYNELTHAVTSTPTRKNQSAELKYRYFAYYYDSTNPIEAVSPMANDNWWECELIDDDGTNLYSKASVDLTQGSTYGFRLIEQIYDGNSLAKQGTIDQNFWAYLSDNNGGKSGFKQFSVGETGTYDVIFSYKPTTDNYELSSTNPKVVIASGYKLITSEGNNWTVGSAMTLENGVYSGVISDWAGKLFATIATANAESFPNSWDGVVRPESDANVTFADASGTTTTTNNNKVWSVANDYSNYIKFSYSPALNKWSVAPYIPCEIKNNNNSTTEGYATFSSDCDVAVPSGVTAFYASANAAGVVTMTKIDAGEINSADGVFLAAAPGTYHFTPATNNPTSITGNYMKKPENGVVPKNGYVLAKQSGNLGFYKVTAEGGLSGQTGKAYLSTTSTAPMLSFDFGEGTTALNEVRSQMEEAREGIFDLQGRRVENPTKGLYIVNGKKVFIK